ncbi:hypothetical protein ACWKSP_27535 [Micromonosporaceae bacterium Da 78-11]
MLFDNIGIGLALGPAIGIAGAISVLEARKAKRTRPEKQKRGPSS